MSSDHDATGYDSVLTEDLGVTIAEISEWRNRQFGVTERERRALRKIDDMLGRIEALEAHAANLVQDDANVHESRAG